MFVNMPFNNKDRILIQNLFLFKVAERMSFNSWNNQSLFKKKT